MQYETRGRALVSTISVNGAGTVSFLAENVRYERTGLHAKISIVHNQTYLDYDVFNVERSEDRRRLVSSAQKQFGKTNGAHYSPERMKADLDRFCLGLETEWQNRIPMTTITAGIDDVPPTPPPFLAYPLLLENQPNLLFGERSSAKSLTAALLVTTVLLPWQTNPLGIMVGEQVTRTIWCDWEWGEADITYHVQRLCKGHNLTILEIHHQPMVGPLARNISLCQRLRLQTKASLMICDSATMACGAVDLNKTDGAIQLYEAVREIGGTWLILAHTSKDETPGVRKTVFGSQVYESQARNIWECLKTEPTEDTIEVGLFHRKNPPFTRYHKPLGYRATFSDTTIAISSLDAKAVPEFAAKLSNTERVVQALRGGQQKTTKDLLAGLEMKRTAFDVATSRLRSRRVIQKLDDLWSLLETRQEE